MDHILQIAIAYSVLMTVAFWSAVFFYYSSRKYTVGHRRLNTNKIKDIISGLDRFNAQLLIAMSKTQDNEIRAILRESIDRNTALIEKYYDILVDINEKI